MAEIANVIVGTFGRKIVLTMVDAGGTAVDVSGYDGTLVATFKKPDSAVTQSFTVTFNTDGVDGKLKFTPADGDIDTNGDWDGTVSLENSGQTLKARSAPFVMEVLRSYV